MPEKRLQRARQTLPTGYQFGDARWRHPSQNAAEQLARRAEAQCRHSYGCHDLQRGGIQCGSCGQFIVMK